MIKSKNIKTTVMLNDEQETEVKVTVEYDYTEGRPAVYTLKNGDPGYPEEPEELEITGIYDAAGTEYKFKDLCTSKGSLEEECLACEHGGE
jgi:hypothetical protein